MQRAKSPKVWLTLVAILILALFLGVSAWRNSSSPCDPMGQGHGVIDSIDQTFVFAQIRLYTPGAPIHPGISRDHTIVSTDWATHFFRQYGTNCKSAQRASLSDLAKGQSIIAWSKDLRNNNSYPATFNASDVVIVMPTTQ
ncbi:hypothetical protein [Ktedonospora formicarum]|uniref:Uncharacterized protein n=1 Tax=Ktedonospora formicarum TaxID=2778364 RepID=A0A8J3ICR5_9CHLR|nr:hypothetical protein [Ktedonospora formicarum]GHO48984.1 hypothetical protein KSX_71470 [Ktedonospora formicarum]